MSKPKVLREAGTYTIYTPVEHLRHQLMTIERAGRSCYQSDRGKPITVESATKFINMLVSRGHESVIEHSALTVRFDLHSRGFTHELVRHRIASPSQESTRYVDYELERNTVRMIAPPGSGKAYDDAFEAALTAYEALREAGEPPENARQVLPIGTKSEIVLTANLREWRHIFHMRCDKFAHWEIRRTMVMLLQELQGILPGIFDDFVYGGEHRGGPFYVQLLPKTVLRRQIALRERIEEGLGS